MHAASCANRTSNEALSLVQSMLSCLPRGWSRWPQEFYGRSDEALGRHTPPGTANDCHSFRCFVQARKPIWLSTLRRFDRKSCVTSPLWGPVTRTGTESLCKQKLGL